jgi:hypothetical protein
LLQLLLLLWLLLLLLGLRGIPSSIPNTNSLWRCCCCCCCRLLHCRSFRCRLGCILALLCCCLTPLLHCSRILLLLLLLRLDRLAAFPLRRRLSRI